MFDDNVDEISKPASYVPHIQAKLLSVARQ